MQDLAQFVVMLIQKFSFLKMQISTIIEPNNNIILSGYNTLFHIPI